METVICNNKPYFICNLAENTVVKYATNNSFERKVFQRKTNQRN